jgi:hypothetical protein
MVAHSLRRLNGGNFPLQEGFFRIKLFTPARPVNQRVLVTCSSALIHRAKLLGDCEDRSGGIHGYHGCSKLKTHRGGSGFCGGVHRIESMRESEAKNNDRKNRGIAKPRKWWTPVCNLASALAIMTIIGSLKHFELACIQRNVPQHAYRQIVTSSTWKARQLSAYPRLLTSYSLFGQDLEMHGPAYQTLLPEGTALAIIKNSRTCCRAGCVSRRTTSGTI